VVVEIFDSIRGSERLKPLRTNILRSIESSLFNLANLQRTIGQMSGAQGNRELIIDALKDYEKADQRMFFFPFLRQFRFSIAF
jgi:hypothetical protein